MEGDAAGRLAWHRAGRCGGDALEGLVYLDNGRRGSYTLLVEAPARAGAREPWEPSDSEQKQGCVSPRRVGPGLGLF